MANLTWADIKDLAIVADTRWTRVEGTPRSDSSETALAARLEGGPHWMLAQQYRFGELLGDDAASPVGAGLSWQSRPIAGGTPLEPQIEGDALVPDLRLRIQAGQELARHLSAETLRLCIGQFPLPNPSDAEAASDRSMLRAVFGRVADGLALLDAHGADILSAGLRIPEIDAAASLLSEWRAVTYPVDPAENADTAWDPVELEYHALVPITGNGAEAQLHVDDHLGGRLDWWGFDIETAPDWTAVEPTEVRVTPTPVSFPGMPTSTHWQFQSRGMDFGRIDAARTDLARLVIVEFALVYGEDWFTIPLDLPAGAVVRLGNIEVTDSFGETHSVPPSGAASRLHWDRWSTAHPSGSELADAERARLLVMPPTSAATSDGPPVEEVVIVRDEMANLVWGIERQVADGLGQAETLDAVADAPLVVPPGAGARYSLMSEIPSHWHPFAPRTFPANEAGRTRALELIPVLRTGVGGAAVATSPIGQILSREAPEGGVRLAEEVANRAPFRLIRRFERARDANGRVILWTTTRRTAAPPQPRSELRFDAITL